jgi:hypothetical protein
MSAEVWRVVSVAPDYEVSNLGRVRSHKGRAPRILRPCVNPHGYHNHTLFVAGSPIFTTAHVLVATAFIGPRPEGMEVCHNDGDPGHNALANLRYGTRSENARDMLLHGTCANALKTECPLGHPYNAENTYLWRGDRHCRICRREAGRRYRARRAAA